MGVGGSSKGDGLTGRHRNTCDEQGPQSKRLEKGLPRSGPRSVPSSYHIKFVIEGVLFKEMVFLTKRW